jgi:hypothetical protein
MKEAAQLNIFYCSFATLSILEQTRVLLTTHLLCLGGSCFMESSRQQELLSLWHTLHSQPKPLTLDEALYRLSCILRQTLQDARLLFYLKAASPQIDPLQLLPCPARALGPGVFVYEGSRSKAYFAFKIPYFYYLPLRLNGYDIGYLFLESITLAFDYSAPLLLAFLAGRVAQDLYELRHLIEAVRLDPPEASLSFKLEPAHRQVWVAGQPLCISQREFMLLEALEKGYRQGQPCSRKLLCQTVYVGEVTPPGEREARLDSLVAQVRRKLEQIPGQPVSIKTMRSLGYQLCIHPGSTLEVD